jgi:hypothetical protein
MAATDRAIPPHMPSDTAAFVEAAKIAIAEAIERERALLRIKKKNAAKTERAARKATATPARNAKGAARKTPARKAARRAK